MRKELSKIKEKKYIFTNGSQSHVKNVTKQLGIEDLFDGAFTITDANFIPKPNLEPYKKNTSAAILSSVLIDEISYEQPVIFFPADHLIEDVNMFNKSINFNKKYLDDDNIFIFGIKPISPSSQYGYFLTKNTNTIIIIIIFNDRKLIK